MNDAILKVSDKDLGNLLKIAKDYDRLKRESAIHDWNPLPKQWLYLNSHAKVKAFCACNQGGKTSTAVFEEASHLTGIYHPDWQGVRYTKPVRTLLAGVTGVLVRNTLQEKLFGPIGQWGTGMIPKECIDFDSLITNTAPAKLIDQARIKHVPSGEWSTLRFMSYAQGRVTFQGITVDRALMDEEPLNGSEDIVGEIKTRVLKEHGHLCFTFTPLAGMTANLQWLLSDPSVENFSIWLDDLPWMTEADIEAYLAGMPDYEAKARRYGIAASASGLIYQFDEKQYTTESFPIPKHWPRISGFDCGINHPSTAVSLAWDQESNCVYIYQEYWSQGKSVPEVAMHLKHWGTKFALPHDAFANDKMGEGNSVAAFYKREGFDVIQGDRDREGRIAKVRAMIASGRLWIFKDRCPQLLKEFKLYRSKPTDPGKVLRKDDDTISAFEHAVQYYEESVPKTDPTPQFEIKQFKPFDPKRGI